MQGVGPMILNGTINGLIAWLMFGNKDKITLWSLTTGLCSDIFASTVIQSVLSWLIVGVLIRGDLRKGCISHLAPSNPEAIPQCIRRIKEKIKLKQYTIICEQDRGKDIAKNTAKYTMIAIVLFFIPMFFTLIILTIAVENMDSKLDYKIVITIKVCYCGIMGLVMTPIAAICTMTQNQPVDEESESVPLTMNESPSLSADKGLMMTRPSISMSEGSKSFSVVRMRTINN